MTGARIARALGASPGFGGVSRVLYAIGAQKAGTTWLHEELRRHPQVHTAPVKEVHYWDTIHAPHLPYYRAEAERGLARLEALPPHRRWRHRLGGGLRQARLRRAMFEAPAGAHAGYEAFVTLGWSGQPVVADVSPGYAMMGREGFTAMDRAAPDARFVLILRDPVARLWSNLRHNRSRGFLKDSLEAAFDRALADPSWGPAQRSDYARTIRELEAAVPASRIAYFFYETLFNPTEMRRLSDFLGIAPFRARFDQRVNPGRDADRLDPEMERRGRGAFAPVYEFVADRFPGAVPEAWGAPAALRATA